MKRVNLVLAILLSAMAATAQALDKRWYAQINADQIAMLEPRHSLALAYDGQKLDAAQAHSFFKFYGQGQYDEALSVLATLIEENPRHSDYYFFMAEIYLIKEDYGQAKALFTRVKELEPFYAGVDEALAYSCYRLKNYTQALHYYNQIIAQYQPLIVYHSSRYNRQRLSHLHLIAGDSYMALGQKHAALNQYRLAYSTNQLNVLAQIRLAMSYLVTGADRQKAVELVTKALTLEQTERTRQAYAKVMAYIGDTEEL